VGLGTSGQASRRPFVFPRFSKTDRGACSYLRGGAKRSNHRPRVIRRHCVHPEGRAPDPHGRHVLYAIYDVDFRMKTTLNGQRPARYRKCDCVDRHESYQGP
jgi:hypothetical protein